MGDKFCTMQDVIDMLPQTEWLWPGWLPRGSVTLLVGAPGVGKSMLSLAIAQRVVQGSKWPDGLPNQEGSKPVVWCDTEWAQAITAERIRDWGLDLSLFTVPSTDDALAGLCLDVERDKKILKACIHQTVPSLVVIDSLNAAHGGDQNKAQDARRILQFLGGLAQSYDVGMLVVGHLRKRQLQEGARVDLERISGSYSVSYYSRVVCALEPVKQRLVFSVIKTNYGWPPDSLTVLIEEDGMQFTESPDLTMSRLGTAIKFLEDILQKGPMKYGQIEAEAKNHSISKRQLYKARRFLGLRSTGKGWEFAPRDPHLL